MTRKRYVLGNWKMHRTKLETAEFIKAIIPLLSPVSLREKDAVGIAPAFTSIETMKVLKENLPFNFLPGAQNVFWESHGAFTGEVSIEMVKEAGARFVLVGHSERRMFFAETDEIIAKKLSAVKNAALLPVFCVGESAAEREQGQTQKVLRSQILGGLSTMSSLDGVIMAYEPVWAIGSGKAASAKDVQDAHAYCRQVLAEKFSPEAADAISILYGGSVKPENVMELACVEGVDGFLVGGASLSANSFADIIVRYYQEI
ncbi:triose-phosphate isomerase [Chlamydiifrater phoenicopteri]|uniref:triose-phosphate isomerase n=1 Tax=Chlamydiifrater phoenicopteri TaxID=2681469 RepID=UPI001BCB2A1A|nr:triose-phosphate isomerase [Chlamydiifrater phoenicopteri]